VVRVVSLSTTEVSPRRLTPPGWLVALGVCLNAVTSAWPLAHAARYRHQPSYRRAAPQCISGRTSYLHVRLAFHPYPQLLPQFCNTGGCKPRRRVTGASLWPWIAHVVSGRIRATGALFTLGFPRAPLLCGRLTLRHTDALAGSFYKRHAISPGSSSSSRRRGERPLAAGEYVVSGSVSSPLRGAFHLSLTVLVH
jgi:hypothetical protein